MLATLPISDEIMVFPSALLKGAEEDVAYAFGFCIPNDTPGLRFICRESVDYGRSHFDHPLGSRFEEMDAVVVFDDVFVPWENVLLYRDIKRCNEAYSRTGAVAHMTHQVVVKNIAKSEFMLGLASLLVSTIGAEVFQHIHEKLAELWINLETMKAFLRVAEVDARRDEYGVMRPAWDPLDAARNLFPRLYPGWSRSFSRSARVAWSRCRRRPISPGRCRQTSASTTRQPGRTLSSECRSSASRGMRPCLHSGHVRCCTSASSSAIPYAWRARSSPVTTVRFSNMRSACESWYGTTLSPHR